MATEDNDVGELLSLATSEMASRLRDNPGAFPAHVLARVFDHAVRLHKEKEEPEAEEEKRGLLDWIEEAGLPPERKKELLKEEILRLDEQMGQAYEILRGLEDDDGTGETVAPPEPRSFRSQVFP